MKNIKTFITVLLLVLAIIIIFILAKKPKDSTIDQKQKITIGMVTFPGYAPLFIAKEKEYYGNTEVNLVFIESLGELRSALQSGKIDAYQMTYDMFQSVKDITPDGIAFLATDESRGADGIIASTSIRTPEQLKGKIVGTEPGFPAYLLLLSYLDKAGLTLEDISLKDIPSKDVTSAYISKSIEIGGTYEPYLSELALKAKDSHVLVSTKDTPGLAMEFMWVSKNTLSEKKDALVDIARGYFKAVDLINSNPDEAFAIAAPAFGITKDEMASFKDGIVWPDLEYNKQLLQGTDEKSALGMFTYVGNILRENNETNITLNAKDHITDEIINQLR